MCASLHVGLPDSLAFVLCGAPLGDVVLFQGSLLPVGCTAPTDLRKTHIFSITTGGNGLHAFVVVVFLIITNIAFQTKPCEEIKIRLVWNFDLFQTDLPSFARINTATTNLMTNFIIF